MGRTHLRMVHIPESASFKTLNQKGSGTSILQLGSRLLLRRVGAGRVGLWTSGALLRVVVRGVGFRV